MKLQKGGKSLIKTSETMKEMQYGISNENMGMILEILRSKIYSDPIGSICREIASNSRDANREAKNNIPIKITIADSIWFEGQTNIIFEDDGVGISKERMGDVFIKYGSSTKRENNKQTGGFGLGGKTPFAYTDSFAITTRYNGKEYTYLTAIENQKEGKMYLVEETDTPLKNGTKIIIPIKDEDRREFEQKCYLATGFWEVKPDYINFKTTFKTEKIFNFQDIDIVNNTWKEDEYYEKRLVTSASLLIDEIVYPLDGEKIGEYVANHAPVLYKFKTGELTLSANRETVQYDKPTIKKIKRKVRAFYAHYLEKINEFFEKCPSRWEATMTAYEMLNGDESMFSLPHAINILKLNNKSEIFSYKGNKINWHLNQFSNFGFSIVRKNNKHNDSISRLNKDFNFLPLVFMDTNKFSKAKNETLFKQADERFILITPVEKYYKEFSSANYHEKRRIAKRVRETINQWKLLTEDYGLELINYSEVEKANIVYEKDATGKKIKSHKMIDCRIFSEEWTNKKDSLKVNGDSIELKEKTNIDTNDCVFYIVDTLAELNNIKRRYRRGRRNSTARDWSKELFDFSIITKELGYTAVIAVSKKYAIRIADMIVTYKDVINSNPFEKKIISKVNKEMWNKFKYPDEADLFKSFTFQNNDFNQSIKEMTTIERVNNDVPEVYKNKYSVDDSLIQEYNACIEKIQQKYPLLNMVSRYEIDVYKKITYKNVQDYINLVENAEKTVEENNLLNSLAIV